MIAFLADLHLTSRTPPCRIDKEPFKVVQKKKLTKAAEKMIDLGVTDVLVAGDIFHTPRDLESMETLMDIIVKFDDDLRWHGISGQHDMYYRNSNSATSLAIMFKHGYIAKLGKTGRKFGGAIVYGCSFGEEVPVPKNMKDFNVLVIHESISDHGAFGHISKYNATAFLRNHPQYNLIVCGDIHATFKTEIKGRIIANPGPLFRSDASEYNFSHRPGFFTFDGETLKFAEVEHEPAENVMYRDYIDSRIKAQRKESSFVSILQNAKLGRVNPMEAVLDFFKDDELAQQLIFQAKSKVK